MATHTPVPTQVPNIAHMAAHMRGSLNFQRTEYPQQHERSSVATWEALQKRYQRLVGERLPPVSPPPFARLKALVNSESHADFLSAATPRFMVWHNYVYDLVVASWAFRVGLDKQFKDNLPFVREQWEVGGRAFVRGHADIGLADQVPSIRAALEVPNDDMRFHAMTLGSSVLEELTPSRSSDITEQLALDVRASARTFLLSNDVPPYRHAAAILALQRSLRSLPEDVYLPARNELTEHYIARLGVEDSIGNSALLRSLGGLLMTFGGDISMCERVLLNRLDHALQGISDNAGSAAIKAVVETIRCWKIPPLLGRMAENADDVYEPQVYRSGDLDI